MAEDFDPYYTWLGIPRQEQPAHHYRLLGLQTFESNPDVIENAADQRMGYIRTFQNGPRSEASQRLLNELASARVCLLHEEKKAAYDEQLRSALRPEAPEPPGLPEQPPPIRSNQPPPIPPRRDSPPASGFYLTAGFVTVGVALGMVLLGLFFANGSSEAVTQSERAKHSEGSSVQIAPSLQVQSNSEQHAQGGESETNESDSSDTADHRDSPSFEPKFAVWLGEGDRLEIPRTDGVFQLNQPSTIEAWVFLTGEPTERTFFGSAGSRRAGVRVRARWNASSGKSYLGLYHHSGGLAEPEDLPRRRWMHIALTYDGAVGSIWLDGQRQSDTVIDNQVLKGPMANIFLGAEFGAPKGGLFGAVGAVRVSTVCRYQANFAPPADFASDEDTICLVDLSQASDGEVNDLSRRGRNPIVSGGQVVPVDEQFPGSLGKPTRTPQDKSAALSSPPKSAPAPRPKAKAAPKIATSPARATPPNDLPPPPTDAERAAVLRHVKRMMPAAVRTTSESDKAALAAKLAEAARRTRTDAALRFVLYQEAARLAVEGAQVGMAFSVFDEVATLYQIEPVVYRVQALESAVSLARRAGQFRQLGRIALTEIDTAVFAERFDAALTAASLADKAAARSGDAVLRASVQRRSGRLRSERERYLAAQNAQARLATNPDDPIANQTWGEYLCFHQHRWEEGLPLLGRGGAKEIAAVADSDLSGPTVAEEQAAVGEGWASVAQSRQDKVEKAATFSRARQWFVKATSQSIGVAKARFQQRVEEIDDLLAKGGLALSGPVVSLVPLIDAKRDAVRGDWSVSAGKLMCLTQNNLPRIHLPYEPPEEYDFKVVFSQETLRKPLALILAKGNRSFSWLCGGEESKFAFTVAGRGFGANPTEKQINGLVQAGRIHTAVVKVRNEGLTALLDDRQIIHFATDYSNTINDVWHRLPKQDQLGVGCDDPTIFHHLQVTEITGRGKILGDRRSAAGR